MFLKHLSGPRDDTGCQPVINYFIISEVVQIKHAFLGYTPKKIYRFTVYLSLPKIVMKKYVEQPHAGDNLN